jgi:hypothetical protein
MGEGFQTGGAVFRFVDLARAKAMQQGAQNSAHVGVVVDDEKTQPVEVDADHGTPGFGRVPRYLRLQATGATLTEGFRVLDGSPGGPDFGAFHGFSSPFRVIKAGYIRDGI